jgi:ADP-ribosylglycohydrolase
MNLRERLADCLLGAAVGDALGLPYEGLSPRRARHVLGAPDRYRLVFGCGMVSDDTEHACMTAQALIVSGGDVARFRKSLAWRLRWWICGLPAGIGFATLRAITKLWLGFPSTRSGIYSAGNGPAMRAGILGAAIEDVGVLKEFVTASTRMTHRDPKAEFGAFAVALAAQMSAASGHVKGAGYHKRLVELLPPEAKELTALVDGVVQSVAGGQATADYALAQGWKQGVSGYIYHTVPVALHAWLSHQQNLEATLVAVIACGGDTDTVASIAGAIAGAGCGLQGIPAPLRERLVEWPRSARWIEMLAQRLAEAIESGGAKPALFLFVPAVLLRNLLFLFVVLFHGLRRLLPPY